MPDIACSRGPRCASALLAIGLALLLAACASGPNQAPVEERRPAARAPGPVATPAAAPAAPAVVAGTDGATRPGFYTVKPGDTLIRIALDHGQNWRDVQRWNALENPNLIEVGQQLRVAPPGSDPAAGVVSRPVAAAGRVESRPLEGRSPASTTPTATPAAPAPAAAPAGGASSAGSAVAPAVVPVAPAAAPAATPSAPAQPVTAPRREGDDDVNWLWPAGGPVATPFEDGKYKGVAITGKAGDPVFAAADGRVVYAGSGLRGYGNLVIVKHNNTYLTAYAHNQALLVRDEQVVKRGQKIAEMGSSDAERVQLHFEIRRQGVPVDPQRLLPAR